MRLSTETDRVEAFTDRVLALILAIMVLGLRALQGTEPRSLLATLPAFATFAVSFILIGIYWNNYHHMLRASRGVDGRARWANLHLLFWLSLVPFATAWLGQNPLAVAPTVLYTLICSSVRSRTRSFGDHYCMSTASMLRSQVLSKSTFRDCQSCSMWLRCVRRSSRRSSRMSVSSPRRACCFPDRPVEPLIRLEDKIRDEIRHRVDSLPRARGVVRRVSSV